MLEAATGDDRLISYLVDEAKNGKEALEKVKQAYDDGRYSYGLILMDCNMPIMDGFEATDLIREFLEYKSLPQPMIIALTGYTEDQYINKVYAH